MTALAPPLLAPPPTPITYPQSADQPLADNTLQFQWIVAIHSGLSTLFKSDPNVCVASDLLWYPIEGDNKTRVAPDVLVAFGRPQGHRGAYWQWQEAGLAPQVVFDILSPRHTLAEMAKKLQFYKKFGVEEYYIYNPSVNDLGGYWIRRSNDWDVIDPMDGWISPRLKVKFTLEGRTLALYHPNGQRFATYKELQLMERAETERARADKLAAKLRALGLDPDTV